jgi:hypothetical protein
MVPDVGRRLIFLPSLDTQNEVPMQETEIQDYARQLLEAHGDKALVQAAQKGRSFEEQGNAEEAKTWRHIEAAIKLMRGPHAS